MRQGRVSTGGQAYLVTTVVKGRAPIFMDWRAGCAASRIASSDLRGSRFLAWVVMPDHFHGVLLLGETASLSATLQLFKGRVALTVNRLLGREGALWERAFHDHAMRREEHLERMARYIVANPVRAGLVAKVGDYPFWNLEWEV